MFGAIYTGMSGMIAYSKGLDIISNNVANLNTPGFKVSDPLFRELVYRQLASSGSGDGGSRPGGSGVQVLSSTMSFAQGELRDTGNALNAAIDGDGFFVLDQGSGEYRYTRAGQLDFNDDGVLVETSSGASVMMSTPENSIGYFDLNTARVFEPRATAQVSLVGVLARGGSTLTYELPNITVYDASGTAITLKARFVRNATDPKQWAVDVLDKDGNVVGSGAVSFADDGTPAQDATRFTVSVASTAGDNFDVAFTIGDAASHAGVNSIPGSTSSQVQVLKQDGVPLGSLTRTQFDERGNLTLTYSNGETKMVGTLVLAQFDAPDQLRSIGSGMFASNETARLMFGSGMSHGLGRIVGGQLEMSNVELTQQFTDLIIMQRGYQASSQVSSVANELIQTLLAMESGR
jgi:flagellar hook protein FlgE